MTVRWVTAFLDLPAAVLDADVAFWAAATGSTLSDPRGAHGEFATLVPPDGDPYLKVQRIDGPARVHLDLHVGEVDAQVRRAVDLGATVLHHAGHAVLSSPGGFVLCLVGHPGGTVRPGPVTTPGGAAELVDQVCLDIPARLYDAECVFWAALTGWELQHSARPELAALVRPAGQPLRLLLQRLGHDDDGVVVRAHLDLACGSHRDAVEARHRGLGAERVADGAAWTVLRDPAGLPYCLTPRDPATGVLPA